MSDGGKVTSLPVQVVDSPDLDVAWIKPPVVLDLLNRTKSQSGILVNEHLIDIELELADILIAQDLRQGDCDR